MNVLKALNSMTQSKNLTYLIGFVEENKYLAELVATQSPNECCTSEREAIALFLNMSLSVSEQCAREIIACTSHECNQEIVTKVTENILQTVIEHTLREQ